MTDEELLQHIISRPDDDGARLAYAARLEDTGDVRGEFIRLQCKLETLPMSDPDWDRLVHREIYLLKTYRHVWEEALRKIANSDDNQQGGWFSYLPAWIRHRIRPPTWLWWFSRGFIEEITVPAATFLKRADAIFRLFPVQQVCLTEAIHKLPDLVTVSHCDRLTWLLIVRDNTDDKALELLIDSSGRANLRAFVFARPAEWGRPLLPSFHSAQVWSPRILRLYKTGNAVFRPQLYRLLIPNAFWSSIPNKVWAIADVNPQRYRRQFILLLKQDQVSPGTLRALHSSPFYHCELT